MREPDPLLRRIKLSDLRLFSAVVDAGGMAKAAAQLHISQPAVSKGIASLEQTLGVRLLDRHAGGVTPTIYGDALLQGSTDAFEDLAQSVGLIKFLNDPRRGSCASLAPTACARVCPQCHRKNECGLSRHPI